MIVRLTVPAVLSAALIVYVVVRMLGLANVPEPEVVQVDEVAEPDRVPITVITLVVEQTD